MKSIVTLIIFQSECVGMPPKRRVCGPFLWRLFHAFGNTNLWFVQRLFSMFPTGTAGAALLILRISVTATMVLNGKAAWASITSLWILIAFLLSATSLVVGLLTPYGSTLCCILQFVILLKTGGNNGFPMALSILNGVVVALLGPGAYSVDARIFGRHLLVIPPST